MKYVVVQDMKAETKVGKSIYLFDFFFLLVYGSVTFMLSSVVHPVLQVPFFIFSGICALFFTMKSTWNKKRRNWESIMLYIRKDREVYYPILNSSVATENEMKKREDFENEE